MNILVKSSTHTDQLNATLSKFDNNIELQLLDHDLVNHDQLVYGIDKYAPRISKVHAHLLRESQFGDTAQLNTVLTNPTHLEIFEKSLEVAHNIGAVTNKIIPVVLHINSSYDNIINGKDAPYASLASLIERLLDMKKASLLIENTTVFKINKQGYAKIDGGYLDDNALLAERLCKDLGTDLIAACLDICHLNGSNEFINLINTSFGLKQPTLSVSEYMCRHSNIVHSVHLAESDGIGLLDGHGGIFDTEDEPQLQELLHAMRIYKCEADLVVEVAEKCFITKQNTTDVLSDIAKYIHWGIK